MKKNGRAFTLVDTAVAALIILIIMTASLDVHVLVKKLHKQQDMMLDAAFLASSTIEDLKYLYSRDSEKLAAGDHEIDETYTTHGSIPAEWSVTYSVTDQKWDSNNPDTDYKEVEVTCNYPTNKSVKITGYVYS